MPAPFLLDTNAYFRFFQNPKTRTKPDIDAYTRLATISRDSVGLAFYISEITSIEVYSVLGKYHRGSPEQRQPCTRQVVSGTGVGQCSNMWISPARKKMKPKVFRDMRKLISDVEAKKGGIQATILQLDQDTITKGRKLLMDYADRYNFGSHDALIVGSLIVAKEIKGINLTLVTSDGGVKNVLRDESLPFYDPLVGP
jgi:hypothetical protein